HLQSRCRGVLYWSAACPHPTQTPYFTVPHSVYTVKNTRPLPDAFRRTPSNEYKCSKLAKYAQRRPEARPEAYATGGAIPPAAHKAAPADTASSVRISPGRIGIAHVASDNDAPQPRPRGMSSTPVCAQVLRRSCHWLR